MRHEPPDAGTWRLLRREEERGLELEANSSSELVGEEEGDVSYLAARGEARLSRRRCVLLGALVTALTSGVIVVSAKEKVLGAHRGPSWFQDRRDPLQRLVERKALAIESKAIEDVPAQALVCFDGTYVGKDDMLSFFEPFGSQWTYDADFGGLMATLPESRDDGHHKSMLRSIALTVTSTMSFSVTTKGGKSPISDVKNFEPDLKGAATVHGFLGVALRSLRTGRWVLSKTRNLGGEDQEVIAFTAVDLQPLVGHQITIDIVDTYVGLWGWIAVDDFELQGSCDPIVEDADTEVLRDDAAKEAVWAAKNLGDLCANLDSASKMATFFNALGTAWSWQFDHGNGMFNTDSNRRNNQHPKSILRSIPFTINERTSIEVTTRGGIGAAESMGTGLANFSGSSTREGFLGIALRSFESDHWLLSKRRNQPQEDVDQVLGFSKAELMPYVGTRVTLDIVDTFHGTKGWISLRGLRVFGPCKDVQFKPEPVLPTTTTRPLECAADRIVARPSLFCFSVMSPQPAEVQLVSEQFYRRASIFACNGYTVISKLAMSIGRDSCGREVYTWHNDVEASDMGDWKTGAATSSFLNTQTFLLAWDSVLASNKWQGHDWVVKVDPDCVFFPDRLRAHLVSIQTAPIFILNCDKLGGRMYGALEVFSVPAVQKYHDNVPQCKNMDWHEWGEDLYMESCMRGLGVEGISDFNMVGDDRCTPADCLDTSRAAFHPYKESSDYWGCFVESTR